MRTWTPYLRWWSTGWRRGRRERVAVEMSLVLFAISAAHAAARRGRLFRQSQLEPPQQSVRELSTGGEEREALLDDSNFDVVAWWHQLQAESQKKAGAVVAKSAGGCGGSGEVVKQVAPRTPVAPRLNPSATLSGTTPRAPAHLTAFQKKLFVGHNAYRSAVGIRAIEWDDTLANFILGYMERQDQYDSCRMKHSRHSDRAQVGAFTNLGENLYTSWGGVEPPTGQRVAEAWFNEAFCYRYGQVGDKCTKHPGAKCKEKTGFGSYVMTGHFTQLMWSSVTHVGCGLITCDNYNSGGKKFFAGCSYASTVAGYGGNMVGQVPFDYATATRLGLPSCGS
eukprot:GHVS01037309.1.p1 GENE.GHVS01037309.1~~GHVS01037309.1.p1  ORF type:complete len:337 (-),score=47.92 GHVS01037309.1:647-1657(-)